MERGAIQTPTHLPFDHRSVDELDHEILARLARCRRAA
jgi:hypothetical protein